MRVILALMMLQMVKLCFIGFVVAAQESKGSIISPSLAFLPVIPPRPETVSPIYHGQGSKATNQPSDGDGPVISPSPSNSHVYHSRSETSGSFLPRDSWRTIAPSSPAVPHGSFFQPPYALPSPIAAPIPQKIKDIEPSKSPSPSTIALSPPYEVVPSPSTVQGNMPPSVKASPPQRKAPAVRPPISTSIAPVAIIFGRSQTSPVSQPTEHGNLAPNVDNRNANKSHTAEPFSPATVAIPPATYKKNSTASEPTRHGSTSSDVHKRNANNPPVESVSPESPASPPWKVKHNPPVVHPIVPTITPSILPAPVTPPPSAFPVNSPLVHPSIPAVSPSKLPGANFEKGYCYI